MNPTTRHAERRSPCPVAATLDILGDRWSLLLIRDLFAGKSRFRDLVASPEGIATNILAARIEHLKSCGLIKARKARQHAGAFEYHLTPRGRSLYPVLLAMRDWGLANVRGTRALLRVQEPSTGPHDGRPTGTPLDVPSTA